MCRTLFNLYTRAKHPERVHVGVVQQNSEGDMGACMGIVLTYIRKLYAVIEGGSVDMCFQ